MSHLVRRNVIISYFVWLMATRTAKLLPHLWNRPQDIIHVPAFILFGYYFAIMKLYALFTLHEVRFMLLTFYKFFCAQFSNAAFRLVGVLVLVLATLRRLPLLLTLVRVKNSRRIHSDMQTHPHDRLHTTINRLPCTGDNQWRCRALVTRSNGFLIASI